jgi:hypothetical protein
MYVCTYIAGRIHLEISLRDEASIQLLDNGVTQYTRCRGRIAGRGKPFNLVDSRAQEGVEHCLRVDSERKIKSAERRRDSPCWERHGSARPTYYGDEDPSKYSTIRDIRVL